MDVRISCTDNMWQLHQKRNIVPRFDMLSKVAELLDSAFSRFDRDSFIDLLTALK